MSSSSKNKSFHSKNSKKSKIINDDKDKNSLELLFNSKINDNSKDSKNSKNKSFHSKNSKKSKIINDDKDKKSLELLFNSIINDNSKDSKGIENFLLKKKRVSELNKISKELSSNKSKGKSGKLSKNFLKSKKGSESFSYNEEYEYNSEITDIVDAEQNDLLEAMFLEAKNSEGQNKIELFLDIIESDETRGRSWSYRSHEEICLIFLESEEHENFLFYYKKLGNYL